ncbi:MAG: hypothetical protein V3T30_08830 [Thermodesulfobacteriota bacterium]
MDGLRQYFVIFFLALFVVGTTAGVAISHCGSARQMDAIDSTVSTSKSCESGDHAGATEDHQKKSETGSSGCDDCSGTICQTQSPASVHSAHTQFDNSYAYHTQVDIYLKTIFISAIPDPPNYLS